MAVDLTNYESYLIDYLDGNLSAMEVAELILFLENNPEIKSEFNELELVQLSSESNFSFPNKSELKKNSNSASIANDSFTHSIIRKFEGELTENEEQELNHFIRSNPTLQREEELIYKTKLIPDYSITYAQKESLKKTIVIPLFRRYAVAAAWIAFLVAIPVLIYLFEPLRNQQFSAKKIAPDSNRKKSDEAIVPFPAKANSAKFNNSKMALVKPKKNTEPRSDAATTKTTVLETTPLYSEVNPSLTASIQPASDSTVTSADAADLASHSTADRSSSSNNTEEEKYLSWKEIAENRIKELSKENLTLENVAPTKSDKKISGWEIAAVGARMISKVTGKKIQLRNKYDNNGDLKAFAIVSPNFEFSRSR